MFVGELFIMLDIFKSLPEIASTDRKNIYLKTHIIIKY